MKDSKVHYNVRIEKSLLDQIKELAAKNFMPVSQAFRAVIRKGLKN